jgi:hypothetical protein
MQYVLDEVEPMYVFLRFVDQEKSPTLGEVHMQYTNTNHTYRSKFENDSARYNMIMDVDGKRKIQVPPTLDEDSPMSDIPLPSTLFNHLYANKDAQRKCKNGLMEQLATPHWQAEDKTWSIR